eukprot:3490490-Prymnesium_polylepis.1
MANGWSCGMSRNGHAEAACASISLRSPPLARSSSTNGHAQGHTRVDPPPLARSPLLDPPCSIPLARSPFGSRLGSAQGAAGQVCAGAYAAEAVGHCPPVVLQQG